MIRVVSLRKAALAGAAGALAWEVALRPFIVSGMPLYDIVHLLGGVAVPLGPAVLWWPAGLALHLAVGVIWAVFYAYFFWSTLRVAPAIQGLIFSAAPALLTGLVLHPQLELMHPVRSNGELHYSGLFGIDLGWPEPLGVLIGHAIYGLVMGALYTRPVGYPAARAPATPLRGERVGSVRRLSPSEGGKELPSGFMFATGIECSYPTIEGGRWRLDEMESTGHYRRWRDDLELVRQLGLRHLRYGPPLHLIFRGPKRFDWSAFDPVAAEMQRLGITPIIDLCHFGVPTWLENFQNAQLGGRLGEYARAFAERYPWIRLYTPINEMYVCARLSALDGVWNEQLRSDRAFVAAVKNMARANILMMKAIRCVQPDAVFINSESSEFYQASTPNPDLMRIADFENQRRFMPLDLIYGHPLREDVRQHAFDNGLTSEDYNWFMRQDVTRDAILGVDYYEWNEKIIDSNGRPEAVGELFGWYVIASQYYGRYKRRIMHTETNRMDAKDAPRWLLRQWHNVELFRKSGAPVVGFTWYSLVDQVDWNIGMSRSVGDVNPVGLFDLNRDPRPVALTYRQLVESYAANPQALLA